MMAMDDATGKSVSEDERIRRSIRDILTTTRGTRVLNRDYGCDLIDLIDRPINSSLRVAIAGKVIAALRRWEPRIVVGQVELMPAESHGKITIKVSYSVGGKRKSEEVKL